MLLFFTKASSLTFGTGFSDFAVSRAGTGGWTNARS
jgi:hypothetical protein